jgi:hypothetical protein
VLSVLESEGGVLVIVSEAKNAFAVNFGVGEVFPENRRSEIVISGSVGEAFNDSVNPVGEKMA